MIKNMKKRTDIYLYNEDFERICRSNTVIIKEINEVVALLLYISNSKS